MYKSSLRNNDICLSGIFEVKWTFPIGHSLQTPSCSKSRGSLLLTPQAVHVPKSPRDHAMECQSNLVDYSVHIAIHRTPSPRDTGPSTAPHRLGSEAKIWIPLPS